MYDSINQQSAAGEGGMRDKKGGGRRVRGESARGRGTPAKLSGRTMGSCVSISVFSANLSFLCATTAGEEIRLAVRPALSLFIYFFLHEMDEKNPKIPLHLFKSTSTAHIALFISSRSLSLSHVSRACLLIL